MTHTNDDTNDDNDINDETKSILQSYLKNMNIPNLLPNYDYSSYTNYTSETTTDTSNKITGNGSNTSNSNTIGAHTHTINNPWVVNTSVDWWYDQYHTSTHQSILDGFDRVKFLKMLCEGSTVYSALEKLLPNLNDDGVVEAIQFIVSIGQMSSELYWRIVHDHNHIYIMLPEFHDIENCKKFFEITPNKNLIKFTRKDILNSKEFKNYINTMKLKYKF